MNSHILDTVSFGSIVVVRDRLLDLQAQGKKVHRLESGDPNFGLPEHVEEAINKALRDGQTHYTASTGILPLRKAIVQKLQRDNDLTGFNPDQVVVTSGGMHALFLTFSAMLDKGDEVLIPDPMWTEIAENIRIGGGVPVRVPIRLNSERPWTVEDLESRITPRTKAIFVNTPHNPTGVVFSREVLSDILRVCEKHDLRIISDEAYEHVIFDGVPHVSIGSLPGADERTVTLFSTSKSYAMSGLRVGYIVARDQIFLERVKKLLRCSVNGVNSIAQWGAAAAMNAPINSSLLMAAEYQKRRDLLIEGLRGLPFVTFKPTGSFFLWAKILPNVGGGETGTSDEAMTDFLIDQGCVGSAPGSAFGPEGKGYIRFAFSCATPDVEAAIAQIRQIKY